MSTRMLGTYTWTVHNVMFGFFVGVGYGRPRGILVRTAKVVGKEYTSIILDKIRYLTYIPSNWIGCIK